MVKSSLIYNIFSLIFLNKYLRSTYLIWGAILATELMGFIGETYVTFYIITVTDECTESTEKDHIGFGGHNKGDSHS